VRFIDPTYLSVMKIPVLQGRGIEERDREGAPRAILISESMAKRYWEDVSPLGQHLIVYMGKDQSPWEIVGVVPDVNSDIAEALRPTMYFPYAQFPYRFMVLTVRTRQDANAMIESIRQVTRTLDPDQPLSQIRTLDQLLSETLLPWRFSMTLLGSFAALALLLAAAGIYGVISYAVGQRTNEIGIRMVLGAQPKDVLRMVIRHGASIAFIGIAVGLAGAFYLTRFMTSQLYQVPPSDPLTYAAIALLLGAVALIASYIPARRATRVDPVVALRYE
jgi:putative ABC transport system permease protein